MASLSWHLGTGNHAMLAWALGWVMRGGRLAKLGLRADPPAFSCGRKEECSR